MRRKYLTSPTACKLYMVEIKEDEVRDGSDWSNCIIIQDDVDTKSLITEIRSTMEKFKDKCKWAGDKKYFYVTTGYASHFKNLHVIKGRIKSKEAAIESQPCNFFSTKADAEKLLMELKNIFSKYGFSLN